MLDTIGIQQRLRQFRNERDWQRFHTPQNLAQALAVEAGELLREFLWGDEWSIRTGRPPNYFSIKMECADVLIYLLQLCDTMAIDLTEAVEAKMRANERKYPANDIARI